MSIMLLQGWRFLCNKNTTRLLILSLANWTDFLFLSLEMTNKFLVCIPFLVIAIALLFFLFYNLIGFFVIFKK